MRGKEWKTTDVDKKLRITEIKENYSDTLKRGQERAQQCIQLSAMQSFKYTLDHFPKINSKKK